MSESSAVQKPMLKYAHQIGWEYLTKNLLVPNHGKLFKCFMSAYLPDWEEKEQKLQMSQNSPNNSKFSSDFLPSPQTTKNTDDTNHQPTTPEL